ncbi:LysR substrate-binding domain-containing protein [Methylobacterium nodulans]|uniref:Transcriptional regulator, LysR family n=1 Tax=Methylobacterium nodulans (strain LMG 21967 / CNCM I-2342 / ORS 2060) TaxID=460265 RepID=B8IXH3_METNO|nr:transcriptional regulator, LysR family [Methylobacterium nodulans ORS 2060]
MRNLTDLYYFAKVAEHGGFSAASRVLDQPKSTLSRRIAALERDLGVRLIQRTNNRFALTEIGSAYVAHCQAMIAEAQAAQQVVENWRAEPTGTLRVSCPIALAQARVSEIVARFMIAHPGVSVRFIATNRTVDLIEEGIDVALRVRFPPLEESDLVMRVLSDSTQAIVGAPALLDRLGRPSAPEALAGMDALDLIRQDRNHVWHLTHQDGRSVAIPFAPRLVSDDMLTLRQAAREGVGVVRLPTYLVQAALDKGDLEAVLPAWTPRSGIIHAVLPSRRGLARATRLFVDSLVEGFRQPARR